MAVINKTGLDGREDFLGFTFNGRHSSEFRIVRTSKSNRYNEEIVASGKDTTIDIPGSDGALFISKKKQKKTWTVDFAFDDVYIEDIEAMRNWLSCKTEAAFRFDEDRESQYHMVVVTGTPKLNYLGFEDEDGKTVYKGDGSVQFTAYDTTRWGETFTHTQFADPDFSFENAGDLPMPVQIRVQVPGAQNGKNSQYAMIKLLQDRNDLANPKIIILNIEEMIEKNVSNILLDSELHLVLGHVSNENNKDNPTSEVEDVVLNDVIVAGDFFEVEPGAGYGISITNGLELVSVTYQYRYN